MHVGVVGTMAQICQDDTRIELSRPGEPGLTTRMVEKCIQLRGPEASLLRD